MDVTSDRDRTEIAGGLRYAHSRANANTAKIVDLASFAYAAIEMLVERGLVSIPELDERKKVVSERLVAQLREEGIGAAYQDPELEKYGFEGSVQIDCAGRMHLCKAACCRLRFALSRQDIEEGIVQWDFSHPYFIACGGDGYCHHLDRGAMACSIHAHRPVPCRAYDCRGDARIWSDFEGRVVSPELDRLFEAPR
jgi:Fe-S-cluster containining protein